MRRICCVIILLLMLSGCSARQTMETVEDVYVTLPEAAQKKISLTLPEEASLGMASGSRRLYFCAGYEIMLEIVPSGDLKETLLELTGYEREDLTVMETTASDIDRYECVWTAVGETGDVVGRAVILDDGHYHYCLSVVSSAEDAGSLQQTWSELLTSFFV